MMRTASKSVLPSDRVYASLSVGGRVVAEVIREGFSDLTALLLLLRRMANMRGLARLTVRNMSRGWSLTEPLMLSGAA